VLHSKHRRLPAKGDFDMSAPLGESHAAERRGSLRSLDILLAEDSPVNQALGLAQLQRHGHRVVVVNNGLEALTKSESHSFGLILMDLQMPEMDGLAATRAIRERERPSGAHVPIVAMTAQVVCEDRERCLLAGMDGYLRKPIRYHELVALLEQLFADFATERAPRDGDRRDLSEKEPEIRSSSGTGSAGPLLPQRVLDWNAALRQNDVGGNVLREMAALFLDQSHKLLSEIQAAISSGDARSLRRSAHTLKGSAAALAAEATREAASRLETIAKEERFNEAPLAGTKLECEIQRLRLALKAQLMLEESGP
jgi:two-component system, sensor histidine kinase and response regulator